MPSNRREQIGKEQGAAMPEHCRKCGEKLEIMARMLQDEQAKRAEVERLLMKRTNQEWRSLQKRIQSLKRGELPRYLRRIWADGYEDGYRRGRDARVQA